MGQEPSTLGHDSLLWRKTQNDLNKGLKVTVSEEQVDQAVNLKLNKFERLSRENQEIYGVREKRQRLVLKAREN